MDDSFADRTVLERTDYRLVKRFPTLTNQPGGYELRRAGFVCALPREGVAALPYTEFPYTSLMPRGPGRHRGLPLQDYSGDLIRSGVNKTISEIDDASI